MAAHPTPHRHPKSPGAVVPPARQRPHPEEKSPHILNTSATLLGFCFIVVTSINVMNISFRTIIDEIATVATLLFMSSCLLSFLSIRGNLRRSRRLENLADYVFLSGLILLFITTLLFSFNIID